MLRKQGSSKNGILEDASHLELILHALICYLLSKLPKRSILPILSKELSNSEIFERIDILKIIKTKINKRNIGSRVSKEIFLKIKNE